MPFVTISMNQEGVMLSERIQTEKGKYCTISLICRTYNNKKVISQKKSIDRMVGATGWEGGEMKCSVLRISSVEVPGWLSLLSIRL